METYVFDACALYAFLYDEEGGEKVYNLIQQTRNNQCKIFLHKLNLLEVYYGLYREEGEIYASEVLAKIFALPIEIQGTLNDNVFGVAGRLKATHKISLGDSIALAEALVKNAQLVTSDHHEFDVIEKKEKIKFLWIR